MGQLNYQLGTPIIWGENGATGVTNNWSVNGLASTSARMGAYADLGASFAQFYLAWLEVETGTAPSAGALFEAWLAWSYTTTKFPGKVDGTDAGYTVGTSDANLKQLGDPTVVLIATPDGNTELRQQSKLLVPRGRYVAPVLRNASSQAVRNTTPASSNKTRLLLYPVLNVYA